MTSTSVLRDLLPLSINDLVPDETTDFDIFIQVVGGMNLYAPCNYHWTQGEIDRLKKEGHEFLFYDSAEKEKVEGFKRLSKLKPIDKASSPAERIVTLTSAGAELTKVLYEYPLGQAALNKATNIATNMVDSVVEDPTCVAALGALYHHDDYTYYHSARVAAYSLAIALELSITNQDQLRDISLGCLLHDIGKSKIDLGIINKPAKLTDKEWEEMRMHPIYGEQVVEGAELSVVHKSIILHHHERLDGGGYPYNLTKGEILDEVKIAMFADVFDALTTNRSYQNKRSRFEALHFINDKLLKGKLDLDAYKAMVNILKRYSEK